MAVHIPSSTAAVTGCLSLISKPSRQVEKRDISIFPDETKIANGVHIKRLTARIARREVVRLDILLAAKNTTAHKKAVDTAR